jgi:hypothetical protein
METHWPSRRKGNQTKHLLVQVTFHLLVNLLRTATRRFEPGGSAKLKKIIGKSTTP